MPAVLLEARSIINRDEELRMGSPEHQAKISAAVTEAVGSFCKEHLTSYPTGRGDPCRPRIEAGDRTSCDIATDSASSADPVRHESSACSSRTGSVH